MTVKKIFAIFDKSVIPCKTDESKHHILYVYNFDKSLG